MGSHKIKIKVEINKKGHLRGSKKGEDKVDEWLKKFFFGKSQPEQTEMDERDKKRKARDDLQDFAREGAARKVKKVQT